MTITVDEFLKEVFSKYKGKQSKVPAVDTDKFLTVLVLTNAKIREWATDPYHEWNSLWQIVGGGTIVVSTVDYDLDDTIQRPSDKAIITVDDQVYYVNIIKLTDRNYPQYLSNQYAYIHGNDAPQLTFNGSIETGNVLIGGTLELPAYVLPDKVAALTDTILIDSIDWLVHIVAAELARNDPAKRAQFPILNGQANEFWLKMVAATNQVPATNPDVIEADLPNMGGY